MLSNWFWDRYIVFCIWWKHQTHGMSHTTGSEIDTLYHTQLNSVMRPSSRGNDTFSSIVWVSPFYNEIATLYFSIAEFCSVIGWCLPGYEYITSSVTHVSIVQVLNVFFRLVNTPYNTFQMDHFDENNIFWCKYLPAKSPSQPRSVQV